MNSTNSVYVTRKFNCSKTELFKWLVDPKLIGKWFGPKNMTVGVVESNATIGGNYKIELIKPDGVSFFVAGNYLEIDEPQKLVFSFKYQGLAKSPPNSVVKINITEEDNSAVLSFSQTFKTMPPDMEGRTLAWEHMFILLSTMIKP